MITAKHFLKISQVRIEQRKNEVKSKEKRDQATKQKLDTRRYIIIGELVCKYFPDAMKYRPQWNKADDAVEFAPLANILRLIADDTELLTRLKEESAEPTLLR